MFDAAALRTGLSNARQPPNPLADKGNATMGSYEFSFVVTGVDLEPEDQRSISQAIGLAGAQALSEAQDLPDDALTVNYELNRWWRGIPTRDLTILAKEVAATKAAKATRPAVP